MRSPRIVRAYCRACTVLGSRSSTSRIAIGARPFGGGEGGKVALELDGLVLVLLVHPHQEPHEQRHQDQDRPGALGELRAGDDDQHDRGRHRPGAVDQQAHAPALLAQPEVSLGHPGLRQRERREDADRVERDQLGDVGVERDHEGDRRRRQRDDPVGEHQAVPARRELPRQEVVARVEVGQAREVGVGGVGRQHEDQHRGDLQERERRVADRPRSVDRPADVRDDGRRAREVRRICSFAAR